MMQKEFNDNEDDDNDVDASQINKLDEPKAFQYALRYLGRKPRSTEEVKRKLKEKGYNDKIIHAIIPRLLELNFINDAHFAKIWTEYRILSRKKGRKWAQFELQQKGISKEHISQALESIEMEDEFRSAMELAARRWENIKGVLLDRKRKITALLLRRGYPASLVNRVLFELNSEAVADDSYNINNINN